MSELEALRALIREEIANIGPSLLPGGPNALPGFDPNYATAPLRNAHDMPTDETTTDGESEFAIGPGESKHFRYAMNNKTPGGGVYGVKISTPAGIKEHSAAQIVQIINGTVRGRSLTYDGDFNRSVGRFQTGTLIIEGQIENGETPGMVRIAYGPAESEEDLNLTTNNPRATLITGTNTITFPKAGRYVVTWLVEETLPA